LRLLGIAETYTCSGYLVVKPYIKNVLRAIYSEVFDSSGRKVGRVVDVIGGVDDPRLVVKLFDRDFGELLASRHERLYYQIMREGKKPAKR